MSKEQAEPLLVLCVQEQLELLLVLGETTGTSINARTTGTSARAMCTGTTGTSTGSLNEGTTRTFAICKGTPKIIIMY